MFKSVKYQDGNQEVTSDITRAGKVFAEFQNGDTFEGEYVLSPKGVFTREGFGTYTWTSKAKYSGTYTDGKRHGHGVYFFPTGEKYEGNWSDGVKQGEGKNVLIRLILGLGKYIYVNGDEFHGLWQGDKRNGQGVFKNSRDKMELSGTWKDGHLIESTVTKKAFVEKVPEKPQVEIVAPVETKETERLETVTTALISEGAPVSGTARSKKSDADGAVKTETKKSQVKPLEQEGAPKLDTKKSEFKDVELEGAVNAETKKSEFKSIEAEGAPKSETKNTEANADGSKTQVSIPGEGEPSTSSKKSHVVEEVGLPAAVSKKSEFVEKKAEDTGTVNHKEDDTDIKVLDKLETEPEEAVRKLEDAVEEAVEKAIVQDPVEAESKPMFIIISGPPAAGKGTQCKRIAEDFGVVHISTGDLLRKAIAEKTPLGLAASAEISKGHLVSDEIVNQILKERLSQEDCQKKGVLLDGYPRNSEQAAELKKNGIAVDCVLLLEVPEGVLIERAVGRRTHKLTNQIYHLTYNPPPEGTHPDDLIHRTDDHEDTVKERIKIYNQTLPNLKTFYEDVLHVVNGDRDHDTVWEDVKQIVVTLEKEKHPTDAAAEEHLEAANSDAEDAA